LDLDTLLSPVTVPEFLDRYFGRSFLHIPGTAGKFAALVSEDPLAILTHNLERTLEAPVRVTRPVDSLGPNRLGRDRVLLQIGGHGDCKIHSNEAEPPVWVGPINQGDALYIPRGWSLDAAPVGHQINIDIENPNGADLLAWLFKHLKREDAFQPDIPRFADPATKADYVTSLRRKVVQFLRAPGLLEKYRRETNLNAQPRHAAGIPWSVSAEAGHSIAFLTPRKIRIKRGDHETILLVAMGKRLGFPQEAAPLLHYLSDHAPVPVEEFYKTFEGDFDRAELSDLLAALSKDGIIGLRKAGSV
jgi:hypothetical protein